MADRVSDVLHAHKGKLTQAGTCLCCGTLPPKALAHYMGYRTGGMHGMLTCKGTARRTGTVLSLAAPAALLPRQRWRSASLFWQCLQRLLWQSPPWAWRA